MDSRPIGVLSSGVGGMTVLEELISAFPDEHFIFFADALRVPYGNKSSDEIIEYAVQLTKWLVKQDVKLIVVTCHTISSIALSYLQSNFSVPILGIVDSSVSTVMTWSDLTGEDLRKIGIIASQTTINSRAHESALRTEGYMGEVITSGCPLFLPILKSGVMDRNIWHATMDYYLATMRDNSIQGLLLASTGFTLLSEYLYEFFDGKVQIFNPNPVFAKDVALFLDDQNMRADGSHEMKLQLYTTGATQVFDFFFHRYFDLQADPVKVVEMSQML